MFLHYVVSVTESVILNTSVEEGELVCPGEEVTFTCTVIEQFFLAWRNEQFIFPRGDVIFIAFNLIHVGVPVFRGPFQIVLTSYSLNPSTSAANMTSTLAVNATLTLNGTAVECAVVGMSAEVTLHVAGKRNLGISHSLHTHCDEKQAHLEMWMGGCVGGWGGGAISHTYMKC